MRAPSLKARIAQARQAGILKPVKVEPPAPVCISNTRMVEIIDNPEDVSKSEVAHINGCAACTQIILRAAKVE